MGEMVLFLVLLGVTMLAVCGGVGYITYLQERLKRAENEAKIYRKELNYQRVITDTCVRYRDFIA